MVSNDKSQSVNSTCGIRESSAGGFPYHAGEQSECLQVLQDVAVLGGDEDHVEFLQRLVHVADAVCFHEGVLLASVHQFGERGQETLDTRPGHFHKLP